MDEIEQIQYMSQQTLDALKAELEQLKNVKILELAKRIDDARQLGDLSENAEYHAAREEMSWAQSRAKEIEYILDHAKLIGKLGDGVTTISIGSVIVAKLGDKTKEFTIVGAQEANPAEGKISNESPIGMAFLGKKKGDDVKVIVPAGTLVYKILEVR